MKSNPLLIIALIFAVSFIGRAAGLAHAAIKQTAADTEETEMIGSDSFKPTMVQEGAVDAMADDVKAEKSASAESKAEVSPATPVSSANKAAQNASLLEAIRERSAQLDRKELHVEDRIRKLEILEKRVEEKIAELKRNNEELSKLVSFASEASQKDISLLAKMYEQMKPQRAAEIFDKMNPTFAAGFLTEMESESAALILGNMSTDKAYETSMIIASRNAAVFQ